MYWPREGFPNIALCTDNQNALSWAGRSRSQSPATGSVFRNLIIYFLINGVGVFPAYIRSVHNLIAAGLARWAEREVYQWPQQERMKRVDAASSM